MIAPLLDTHAWIWWVDHDRRLGRAALAALGALPPDTRPLISDISLWEVAMLVDRGRLSFRISLREWLDAAADPRTVTIVPITTAIAAEVAALPDTFHRDPADRLIVASCRVMQRPIVTNDRRIVRAKLVERWKPSRQTAQG